MGVPADHRSGTIVLVGLPNVGKSTLLNRLVGRKLASVTHKPQTTRHRIMGVVTTEHAQMILLDTPGLIEPRSELQSAMQRSARKAAAEADVLLAVADVTRPLDPFMALVRALGTPPRATRVVALNKVDRVKKPALLPMIAAVNEAIEGLEVVPISARSGENVDRLTAVLVAALPEGPLLHPPDTLTEHPERFFVAELIREQVLLRFQHEVPHAVEVEIERFVEAEGRRDEIHALVCVERPSQKRILVGSGGTAIRDLGIAARASVESFLERPVVLKLFVKVVPHWRTDPRALRRLGYER